MSIEIRSKRKCNNPKITFCQHCGKELIRVFQKGGVVICNNCSERLDISSGSSGKRYIKCPYSDCGYEGSELLSPNRKTKCPRCSRHVLMSECNI